MYRQTFNIPPDNLPAADAPVCSSQQKEVFGAARGELVAVECALEANPDTDLAFEWTFTKGDERLDMQQSQIRCVSADKEILCTAEAILEERGVTLEG